MTEMINGKSHQLASVQINNLQKNKISPSQIKFKVTLSGSLFIRKISYNRLQPFAAVVERDFI
jgi:hypothetical protein